MDLYYDDVLINATELVKDRFFFISIKTDEKPKSTTCTHYFSVDNELVYESFFHDFGPLNLSMLYHYCVKLNKKMKSAALQKKRIVHYTTYDEQKRANAAFLACSYAIVCLNLTPERVFEALATNNSLAYADFRDASVGAPYLISLKVCLSAIYKAHQYGFFNFEDFDFLEYEHYERVENGDLNWIVPGKFIGFCGPHNKSRIDNGYPLHCPETYFSYFRRHKVTTIVRLNKKMYEASKFTKAGFVHKDLYFIDGSTPSDRIVSQFISICEKTEGAVAVHCKAGLGRTGSLIACYLMKHYKLTAHEAIAWIRICRPGSIIGHQQNWLEGKQALLWKAGDEHRSKLGITELPKHTKGIYSYNRGPEISTFPRRSSKKNDVSGILQKVDTMQLEDKEDIEDEEATSEPITQGDRLNQIKAQRRSRQVRQIATTSEKKVFCARVLVSPLDSPSVLRGGKVIGVGIKSSAASTSRSITKSIGSQSATSYILPALQTGNRNYYKPGNGANERQVTLRRSNPRKTFTTATKSATVTNGQGRTARIIHRSSTPKKGSVRKVDITSDHKTSDLCNGDANVEPKSAKRGKRSLTLEKERPSPRSTKVLRRSHIQSFSDTAIRSQSRFHLPHVNKNSKTP